MSGELAQEITWERIRALVEELLPIKQKDIGRVFLPSELPSARAELTTWIVLNAMAMAVEAHSASGSFVVAGMYNQVGMVLQESLYPGAAVRAKARADAQHRDEKAKSLFDSLMGSSDLPEER